MRTKITLYSDSELIREAKRYAQEEGISLSRLVTQFFEELARRRRQKLKSPTPISDSLRGVLRTGDVDEKDYRQYLEKKYL